MPVFLIVFPFLPFDFESIDLSCLKSDILKFGFCRSDARLKLVQSINLSPNYKPEYKAQTCINHGPSSQHLYHVPEPYTISNAKGKPMTEAYLF